MGKRNKEKDVTSQIISLVSLVNSQFWLGMLYRRGKKRQGLVWQITDSKGENLDSESFKGKALDTSVQNYIRLTMETQL